MVPPRKAEKRLDPVDEVHCCDNRHGELMRVAAEVKMVNKLMWLCVTLLTTGLIKIFLEGN